MTKEDVVMPKGLEVETLAGELKILFRSRHKFILGILLLPGSLIAIPVWFFIFKLALQLDALSCAVPGLLMNMAIIYYALCCVFNKETIRITRSELEVKRSPLPFPFPRNQRLDSASIEQLYVKEEYLGGDSYQVHTVTKSGSRERLLTGLLEERALYLEQEIERFLGIEDRPV